MADAVVFVFENITRENNYSEWVIWKIIKITKEL